MASTSLSQRWLSEVEAVGTLINRKSLKPCHKKSFCVSDCYIKDFNSWMICYA
ncbi:hypothetical protein [Pseudanabaena yagii]|uniref:Uncharacterized protein n=1 Tax=Pseudanabaena yagii GIHE-NHR1 TaxID=2722753 RepID=A0ABX1LY32_9CYAN|nr:hypothetical protein [Pseudanabaena yagii]NMF59654.1 hypothetical protein [Pseudanabaena yagii GIHE-NHR1]